VLAKPCPQQFSQPPSRLDEAQRRTPLVEMGDKDMEIKRLQIPEWNAELLVPRGPTNLILGRHFAKDSGLACISGVIDAAGWGFRLANLLLAKGRDAIPNTSKRIAAGAIGDSDALPLGGLVHDAIVAP
jgi:hypothetical protein